jgi:amino-acid N-acetyltransferase
MSQSVSQTSLPVIRPARTADVPRIAAIINDYAERGRMLHRSYAELYEGLRDLVVGETVVDSEDSELAGEPLVVGVVGLRIMWSNLAEVYALAVSPLYRGHGLGKRLVAAAADEARRLGIRRIFALTYEREFFDRCGFEVVNRHQSLPAKVWSECIRCPKNQACDEIAMVREFADVPDIDPIGGNTQEEYKVPAVELPVLSPRMVQLEISAPRIR